MDFCNLLPRHCCWWCILACICAAAQHFLLLNLCHKKDWLFCPLCWVKSPVLYSKFDLISQDHRLMKFIQACTDSSFLSLLVCCPLPFEWGFSPWTNIPTAHKLQTNSPQLKTLKSNNTHAHTHHTWHPCCTSYFSIPILHNHKTEKRLQKTQNRNQFSQIHTPMFLGLPLSPSLGNPNLGKNNKVGHLEVKSSKRM
jgi:hypothetical protein